MKVAVVGAGGVGGLLASGLAACADVCVLARGASLNAIKQNGIRVHRQGAVATATALRCSDDARELGIQDVVVIAVKAPSLPMLAPTLQPMIGPQTIVLPAMNGVPWWFCKQVPGFDSPLTAIDPHGEIDAALPIDRVLGCVVHFSAFVQAPGVVHHGMGRGLIVGEPFGGDSERVHALATTLSSAGFDVTASPRIRDDIWYKLWGNLKEMTVNSRCNYTGLFSKRIPTRSVATAFTSVFARLGWFGRR